MPMSTDNALIIRAVLLYIIKNSSEERRDVYSIVKTAYYAQQLHLSKWAQPIYRDNIAALPFGPVPSYIYDILKLARGEKSERRFLKKYGLDGVADAIGFNAESFYVKEDPEMDYLSVSNIECLDAAIEKVASMDFDSIAKDTHGEEWKRVFYDESLRFMDDLNIAREGGASEDVISYLQESLEMDKLLG